MSFNYKIRPNSHGIDSSIYTDNSNGKQLDRKRSLAAKTNRLFRLLSIKFYDWLWTAQNIDSKSDNKLEIDIAVLKFIMAVIIIDIAFYSCFWLFK